jgi:hypothetical protein
MYRFDDDNNDDFDPDFPRSSNPLTRVPRSFLIGTTLILATLFFGGGGYFWWYINTPLYALETWVDAIAEVDSETVTQYTCSQQQQLATTFAFSSVFLHVLDSINLTDIPGVKAQLQAVGADIIIEVIKSTISIDSSELSFSEQVVDENTVLVTVDGFVTVKVLTASIPHHIDDVWLVVYEDDQWKWCGQHQNP